MIICQNHQHFCFTAAVIGIKLHDHLNEMLKNNDPWSYVLPLNYLLLFVQFRLTMRRMNKGIREKESDFVSISNYISWKQSRLLTQQQQQQLFLNSMKEQDNTTVDLFFVRKLSIFSSLHNRKWKWAISAIWVNLNLGVCKKMRICYKFYGPCSSASIHWK